MRTQPAFRTIQPPSASAAAPLAAGALFTPQDAAWIPPWLAMAAALFLLPLYAQEAAPQEAAPQEAAPQEAKPAAGQQAAESPAAESPAVDTEAPITVTADVGYRWAGEVRGDFNSFRSVVNLGDGPKLFGLDFFAKEPSGQLFDSLRLTAHNWGGDPYNTVRFELEKGRAYRLRADYRNIDYFNFLPSFANPAIEQGGLVNQRSFDIRNRYGSGELELLPGNWITPFFAYTRSSQNGRGITPFVANGNEYPVASRIDDFTNNFRGGARLNLNRLHITIEQGGTTFEDNQFVSGAGERGNRTTPLLGRSLFLAGLEQAYKASGESTYTQALLTARPFSWLDLHGQFQYSKPQVELNYSENATGLFYLGASRFFNGLGGLLTSLAKQPHSSGLLGFEVRPLSRLRVIGSVMTDRFHNASSALLTERLLFATGPAETSSLFPADRLALNYSRQQMDVFLDITRWLTLRGGQRYVWGDAQLRGPSISVSGQPLPEQGKIRQQIGIAGFQLRPGSRLRVNAEYEGSPGDVNYFRTSLQNFHRASARGRYQFSQSLLFHANFSILDNRNPAAGIDYEFRSRAASLSVQYFPWGGKYFSLLGDYTRSTLRSDITYFAPQILERNRSFYRDDAHTATALLDVKLPKIRDIVAHVNLGGSLLTSGGSRPVDYYQPVGRLLVPLHKRAEWYAEWHWYSLTQAFYLYEGFRSNQFTTGLRLSM